MWQIFGYGVCFLAFSLIAASFLGKASKKSDDDVKASIDNDLKRSLRRQHKSTGHISI